MFWSKARGKVGDIVLSQVKGQTITRAYQPTVANPRSDKQMQQRIPFANAVKFYKFATQNLFKFAFEDKKQTESDYNAFMRYNAKNFCLVKKDAYESAYMVPIGLDGTIIASAGRLGNIDAVCLDTPETSTDEVSKWTLSGLGSSLTPVSNWGAVSKAIIDAFGLLDGDYLTIVHIGTDMATEELFDVYQTPVWYIRQFRLDSSSTAEVPDCFNITQSHVLEIFRSDINWYSGIAQYMGVIVSRVQPSGTWVSTSKFVGNLKMVSLSLASKTEAYKNQALASWDVGQQAILQGSIVENLAESFSLEACRGASYSEEEAWEMKNSSPGMYLDTPEVAAGFNYYVWIKGEKLNELSDSDISFGSTIIDDAVWVNAEVEHRGYRLMMITINDGAESLIVQNVAIKGVPAFKIYCNA